MQCLPNIEWNLNSINEVILIGKHKPGGKGWDAKSLIQKDKLKLYFAIKRGLTNKFLKNKRTL